MLKIDKKSYKDISIYNIGYISIKTNGYGYDINISLRITHAGGYIEEINGDEYIIFDSRDKELLKKYNDVFNGIMDKIKEINSDDCYYEKDYMKIKFNLHDDLPLNKPLKFHLMTITIKSVFEEDGKLYPQVFLDDTLYELSI